MTTENVYALIEAYNAHEREQSARRGVIFDAVAGLGPGHRRMTLRSHSYTWPTTFADGQTPGNGEYEQHRERFCVAGDASITDHDLEA